MNESDLTQLLDERSLLNDARGPGVYALEVTTPDTHAVIKGQWDADHDQRPPDDALDRIAEAETVVYVGASSHVYDRLCDHVSTTKRQASLLATFPSCDVIDVWPTESPFDAEYNRAVKLARDDNTVVWCDGELYG